MKPFEVALTWKNKDLHEILFTEFCLYNVERFKKIYGAKALPDDFMDTMHHLCFEEEIPTNRPDPCFVYWSKPSKRVCNIALEVLKDKFIDDDLRYKLNEYIAFHDANKIYMGVASRLMSDHAFQIQPLHKLLKPVLKIKLFKAEEFQNTIVFALKRLAFAYAGQLKENFNVAMYFKRQHDHKNTEEEYKDFTNDHEYLVDLDKDKILNPILLAPYKKDKIAYLKILGAWLREVLEYHREFILVPELPIAYKKAFVFLEDIQQTLVKTKMEMGEEATANQYKDKQGSTLFKTEKIVPYRIFASAEAYDLFCMWSENATMKKQIEFIYRHMSEKENPPLILVKDKEFRDWYNALETTRTKLESTTATYSNCKNEDRLLAYLLAKKMCCKETSEK